jgi:hypothetical protein
MAIVKEDCTSLGGCINGEIGGTCINAASGGTSITPLTCGTGEHLYKANSDGTFVCSADTGSGGTSSPWDISASPAQITYDGGNVGIKSAYPAAELEVGGKIIATEFCLDTDGTADVCESKSCAADMKSGASGSTCFSQATLTALESMLGEGESSSSYWTEATILAGNSVYFNETGNVGIGTTNPSAKLNVYNGDVKISRSLGSSLGNLTVAGSIQVGGNQCPAAWATCSKPGEIAACGAGGGILACAGVDSQWMPITSHDGTIVGTTTTSCSSAIAGKMRFLNGISQALQICMKETGSSTYNWRTIMSGGGMAQS